MSTVEIVLMLLRKLALNGDAGALRLLLKYSSQFNDDKSKKEDRP
jgi:hypothetical protein